MKSAVAFWVMLALAQAADTCASSENQLLPSAEFQALENMYLAGRADTQSNALTRDLDIPALREQFSTAFKAIIPPVPGTAVTEEDCAGRPCRTFVGKGVSADVKQGVVLYFHGGGYFLGDIGMYEGIVGHLTADLGLPVVHVDYSLAPETLFPASVSECVAAYEWLLSAKGVDPSRVVLAGDSAGGGMVLLVLQALRTKGAPMPAAAIPISPWTDLSMSGESVSSMALADCLIDGVLMTTRLTLALTGGKVPLQSPLVSPLFGSFAGLPPLFFMVGQNEVLLSDTTRAAALARASGVAVTLEIAPHMLHVYPLFGDAFPEARAARERMSQFIAQFIGNQ